MESRLVPVNAVLALVARDGGWFEDLAQQGFRLHALELDVQSTPGVVRADVVVYRLDPDPILLIEGKRGRNVEERQARGYAAADVQGIRARADLPNELVGRPAVGVSPLYVCLKAASKLNSLMRAWVANLSVTVLPVLSRMKGSGDSDRERDLLLIGTRYILVATVGPTVALMVLCDRLLGVWLGDLYTAAAPAAVIFLAVWLVSPNLTIAATMAIVSRRLRQYKIAAWSGAAVNLALSVVLTAWLGLVGVAIGTLVAYLALIPYFVSWAFKGRDVSARDFAHAAWIPAYGGAVVLATILLAVRLTFTLDHLWPVVGVIIVSVLSYWYGFYPHRCRRTGPAPLADRPLARVHAAAV